MITNKKKTKKRQTRQKQVILDYLSSVKTHPTAETIYKAVKKKLPNISLGTVYRNLDVLNNKGQVQQLNTEVKRFDGEIADHDHFVCEKCGLIIDIKSNKKNKPRNKIPGVGKITTCQVYYFGVCKQCKK